jgi:hypothetical protein
MCTMCICQETNALHMEELDCVQRTMHILNASPTPRAPLTIRTPP